MTNDEIEQAAAATIRQIAAMAGERIDPESPGSVMLAILITAYANTVAEFVAAGVVTVDEALEHTSADLDIIHTRLREQFPPGGSPARART